MRILLWIFLSLPICLFGQSIQGFQALLTIDNDFLGIKNKDEDYTAGAKLEILTPGIDWKWIPFIRFKRDSSYTIHRFSFGGGVYTPQNLASKAVVVGDRPYASITYLTLGTVSYSFNSNFRGNISSDIMIGLIGAAGPGNIQSYMHENHWGGTNRPIPKGWNNQIGFGGSFVASYTIRAQGLIGHAQKDSGTHFKWMDPNWVAKAEIGNYMSTLQGGLRINLLNVGMGILQDYNPTLTTITRPETTSDKKNKWFSVNLFVEPTLHFVMYNATLEGLLFNDQSVYVIPHSQINRTLFQLTAGVNLILGDVLFFRYTMYGRSQEFTGGKSYHSWGSMTMGVSPARWNRSANGSNRK